MKVGEAEKNNHPLYIFIYIWNRPCSETTKYHNYSELIFFHFAAGIHTCGNCFL